MYKMTGRQTEMAQARHCKISEEIKQRNYKKTGKRKQETRAQNRQDGIKQRIRRIIN